MFIIEFFIFAFYGYVMTATRYTSKLLPDSILFATPVYRESRGYGASCEFKLRVRNAAWEKVAYASYVHLRASTYALFMQGISFSSLILCCLVYEISWSLRQLYRCILWVTFNPLYALHFYSTLIIIHSFINVYNIQHKFFVFIYICIYFFRIYLYLYFFLILLLYLIYFLRFHFLFFIIN